MSVTSCEIAPSPRSSGGDFSCTEEELFESFMEIVNNPEIQERFGKSPERTSVHVEDEDLSDNVNSSVSSSDDVNSNVASNGNGNSIVESNDNANNNVESNDNVNGSVASNDNGDNNVKSNDNVNGSVASNDNGNSIVESNDNGNNNVKSNDNVNGSVASNDNGDNNVGSNDNGNNNVASNDNVNGSVASNDNGNSIVESNDNGNNNVKSNDNVNGSVASNDNGDNNVGSNDNGNNNVASSDNVNSNVHSNDTSETQPDTVANGCFEKELDLNENDDESVLHEEPVNFDNSLHQACKDLDIDQKGMLGEKSVCLGQGGDGLNQEDDLNENQSDLRHKNEDIDHKEVDESKDSIQSGGGLSEKVDTLNCEAGSSSEKNGDSSRTEESPSETKNDLSSPIGGSGEKEEDTDLTEDRQSKPVAEGVSDSSPTEEPQEEPVNENRLKDIEQNIEEGIRKTTKVCDEIQEFVNRLSRSSDEILEDDEEVQLEPCSVTEIKIPKYQDQNTQNTQNGEAIVMEDKPELTENVANQPQSTNGEELDDAIHSEKEYSEADKPMPCFAKTFQADDSTTSSWVQESFHHSEDLVERKKSVSDSLGSSEGSLSGDAKSAGTSPGDGKGLINWDILNTAFENPETDEDEGDAFESSGNFGGFGLVLDSENVEKIIDEDDTRIRSVSQSSTLSESRFREEYSRQHSVDSLDRKKDDVLCSGYLLKLGGTGMTPKNWRRRWCVLRHDRCLYYYKTPKDIVPCGIVVLNSYIVSRSSEFHKKNCLKISKGGGRTYFFCSETSKDMLRWMEALRKAAEVVDEGTNFEIRKEIIHNVAIPALSIKKPDCHGYLRKQGAKNRTSWKRRYCVLKNGCLYYYREMADTTALGVAKLHGYKLEEMSSSGRRSGFRAVPPSPGMRTFAFVADNEYDKKRWIPCIEQSIQNNSTSN